jgi:hypothetical protein
MVEAKFHNQLGEKSDLKVVLYVKARFDDLLEQTFEYGGRQRTLDEGWLMTNTKFTENAMHYGRCAKVRMVGWNYPEKGSLRDLAEDEHLHPITCLEGLGARERELLLNNGMVLCTQVVHANSELMRLGISEERSRAIAAEALTFCGL